MHGEVGLHPKVVGSGRMGDGGPGRKRWMRSTGSENRLGGARCATSIWLHKRRVCFRTRKGWYSGPEGQRQLSAKGANQPLSRQKNCLVTYLLTYRAGSVPRV